MVDKSADFEKKNCFQVSGKAVKIKNPNAVEIK